MDGAVTGLSRHIRHGVVGLAGARDAVFARPHAQRLPRRSGEKLITELGWRGFWQRVWRYRGHAIWQDQAGLYECI